MGACCSKIAKMFSSAEVSPDQTSGTGNLTEPLVQARGTGRNKSIRSITSEYTSSSNEFVPINEEWQGKDDELYMGSYWWAKAKGDTGMGLFDNIQPDASNPDYIEAQKQDIDPYGRYPSFSVNIRHPNKPVSSKLAAAAKEAAKKGPRKPRKIVVEIESESDEEIFRKSVLDVMEYDPGQIVNIYPTIKEDELPPPGIDDKCSRINSALSLSKDERDKNLINVYATLSVKDRHFLPARYEEIFGTNLRKEMSRNLKGDFGHLIELLSVPIQEAEVIMLQQIMKLRKKKENYLSRILCGRSNEEMKILKNKYREINHESLEDAVMGSLGRLTSLGPYYRICFDGIVEKYDPKCKHRKEKADEIAKDLYDAGEGKWGTDTSAFLHIICAPPPPFLRQINQAYQKNHKNSIRRAIMNELAGGNQYAVLYGVGMTIDPWLTVAKGIYALYKGLGMDAFGVNMMIVRYQPYLQHICAAYETKYRETLLYRIEYETSGTGSYHDLLERIYFEALPNLKRSGGNQKNKKNILIEQLYNSEKLLPIYPILSDEPPSTIESKCTKIKDALRFTPSERDSMLVNIFGKLSLVEREYIPSKYKEMHNVELRTEMLETLEEGPFRDLVALLSVTPEDAEIIMLTTALEKSDKQKIAPLLCGRQNEEMKIIQKKFKKATGKSLEEMIQEKIKAGIYTTYLSICIQGVIEDYDPKGKHTEEKAEQVAKEFYDAGEGRWGSDTKTLLDIVSRSPPPFLQAVEKYYTENYKSDLKKSIKGNFTQSTLYAVLYGAEMALNPFRYIGRSMERAFAGVGMDDANLNNLVVRYTRFLRPISMAYEDKFAETLRDRLDYEAEGAYHDLLVAMLDNAP